MIYAIISKNKIYLFTFRSAKYLWSLNSSSSSQLKRFTISLGTDLPKDFVLLILSEERSSLSFLIFKRSLEGSFLVTVAEDKALLGRAAGGGSSVYFKFKLDSETGFLRYVFVASWSFSDNFL